MRISDWSSDVCSSDLLGGAVTHTGKSGVADLAFEDDIEALIQLRRFMEFLPASNRETPPVLPTEDPIRRREMSLDRSEERRVGKEGVSTCRSRWWPYH